MLNWWNSLDALQHFFAYVAIPATLILCIQTVLLLFGLGAGGDGEVDSDTSGLDTGDGTAPDLDAPDLDAPNTEKKATRPRMVKMRSPGSWARS